MKKITIIVGKNSNAARIVNLIKIKRLQIMDELRKR